MNRHAVLVGDDLFTLAVDEPAPAAEHWWAIASGRTQDEITESPPTGALRVKVAEPRLAINYGDDGTFCLVARPWLRFPPLAAPAYDLHLNIVSDGYAPLDLTAVVPSHQRAIAALAPAGATVLTLNSVAGLSAGQVLVIGPLNRPAERRRIGNVGLGVGQVTLDSGLDVGRIVGDPVVADEWQPVDLGVIGLRREPVTLIGRAVHRDQATQTDTPIANATITVTDFWWTLAALRAQQPGLMTQPPATRAFAVSVEPGLYANRPAPAGQLAPIVLAVPPGNDRLLVDSVTAGSTEILLSNRQALAAGSLLRIDPDAGDAAETLAIAGIVGYGPPDQPGTATLAFPLQCAHRAGARLIPLPPPPPPGAAQTLRNTAAPGDRCVFVDGLGGLIAGSDIQLTGGIAGPEYQRIGLLQAVSDPAGYFRFPAIQRIAALQFHAIAAGFAAVDFTFQPDYTLRENSLLVVFT